MLSIIDANESVFIPYYSNSEVLFRKINNFSLHKNVLIFQINTSTACYVFWIVKDSSESGSFLPNCNTIYFWKYTEWIRNIVEGKLKIFWKISKGQLFEVEYMNQYTYYIPTPKFLQISAVLNKTTPNRRKIWDVISLVFSVMDT